MKICFICFGFKCFASFCLENSVLHYSQSSWKIQSLPCLLQYTYTRTYVLLFITLCTTPYTPLSMDFKMHYLYLSKMQVEWSGPSLENFPTETLNARKEFKIMPTPVFLIKYSSTSTVPRLFILTRYSHISTPVLLTWYSHISTPVLLTWYSHISTPVLLTW